MAALVSRLHHISLHVSNVEKTASDLACKLKFNLFASRQAGGSRQLALRKGSAIFVVNERARPNAEPPVPAGRCAPDAPRLSAGGHGQDRGPGCLYDVGACHSVDTVSNVCFEVEDVQRSFDALRRRGCSFLVPPTAVRDEKGVVTYSVLKSVVGNVCHTLVDRTKYGGDFLPGFDAVGGPEDAGDAASCPITHFDHVTYACPRRSTQHVTAWYEQLFGFRRFLLDSDEDEDEGFVVDQEGVGLRLTAMEYWKCSRAGVTLPSARGKEPDCKFVIAESLPEQGRNQVDTFLEQHGAAGIQHVGLYTSDIVSTARAMSQAGAQFFSPPPAYYTQVGKQQEIEEAGHNPQMLAQHGILLDTDLRRDPSSPAPSKERRYLLQVFTRPIFAEDTFFLELIERRGATGFGEGNIRALWRSVQAYMEGERAASRERGRAESARR